MVDTIETTAKLFKALAEANRLRIVMMLRICPLCVCEIAYVLGLDQSTVSRHLGKLRASGLVSGKRQGQWTEFKLTRLGRDSTESKAVRLIITELGSSATIKGDIAKVKKADRRVLCK